MSCEIRVICKECGEEFFVDCGTENYGTDESLCMKCLAVITFEKC